MENLLFGLGVGLIIGGIAGFRLWPPIIAIRARHLRRTIKATPVGEASRDWNWPRKRVGA